MGTKNYARWITTLHYLQTKLKRKSKLRLVTCDNLQHFSGMGGGSKYITVSSGAIHAKKTYHFLALLGVVFNNRITITILRFHYRGFSWKRI